MVLETPYVDGTLHEVGDRVRHVCSPGMKFKEADRFADVFIETTCLANNEWDNPNPWDECVPGLTTVN